MSSIDELASRCGIASEYEDYQGQRCLVSADTKRAVLRALGRVATMEGDADEALRRAVAQPWREALPPVVVARAGRACEIMLTHAVVAGDLNLAWRVNLEDGAVRSGTLRTGEVVARAAIDGRDLERRRVALPADLPLGYHLLHLSGPGALAARAELIVVPERCYQPVELRPGVRRWGLAVQLYTLRSSADWGMGDFGDLRRLIEHAAQAGADFVGLNPIHALYPARPAHCSPYGPSSRAFLNVLYVDVAAVPELQECARARHRVAEPSFAQRVAQLRSADLVDYPRVAELKLGVLRELHLCFRARHRDGATERGRAFRAFVAQAGEPLAIHALFDTLCEHFGGRGWRSWPAEYRDPRGAAARRFASTHAEQIELYQYLQWLADEQLAAAQAEARACGMLLGVYRDLAVGVDADGADAWAGQQLYRSQASVGAPPDALALQGQDWGLPPIDPEVLRARAYRDFVQLLRMNMRHCGALRIDHVMALMRLWWVPQGMRADAGAYVSYPFDDLLGILALESVRNRCLVIGEDLGTVPESIREALPVARVYSYRVLYFEKESGGCFRAPAQYSPLALATVTTHDLPPIVSYWEGADLALRDRLRLFPSDEARVQCYVERAADREALLRALAAERLLPHEQDPDSAAYTQMSWELAAAIHVYLARSASALMAVQAEDLLLMRDPVNLPGTSTEYPNWQRKLTRELDELFASERVRALCARLRAERATSRPDSDARKSDGDL